MLPQPAEIADKIIDCVFNPFVQEVQRIQRDEIELGAFQLPDGDPKVTPAVRLLPR